MYYEGRTESQAALNPFIVCVFIHHCDSVLHQLLSEVMIAVVNPVRAAHIHDKYHLFPLTVSCGREPSTWVRLWYICSAVPSRKRPHPPINNVSPNNQNRGQVEAEGSGQPLSSQTTRTMDNVQVNNNSYL